MQRMVNENFVQTLKAELDRVDGLKISKRHEHVIEGFRFPKGRAPRAVMAKKEYMLFNSNDYLGLRFHPQVKAADHDAVEKFGVSPGSVRFISGTYSTHRALENELARFHGRDDCILFSSAFAANLAVIHCLAKGQSKDSLVSEKTLIVSDELNHRSIIDGIRVVNFPKEQRCVYKHLDFEDLKRILEENKGKYTRVLVISDGVFSMLGEYADLAKMHKVTDAFQLAYAEGVLIMIDDCHGVASLGTTGKGTEEASGGRADVLVGTLGKGFGGEGGYVVADQVLIDYMREAAATYIFSNPISPGTASAGAASVQLVAGVEGNARLMALRENIAHFKYGIGKAGFSLAAESSHAVQPILIGDPVKTKALVEALFKEGILVTNINYPVVPKGRDEIRIQLSALHTKADLDEFVEKAKKHALILGILS
jgi:glycine C-acetyltransferase